MGHNGIREGFFARRFNEMNPFSEARNQPMFRQPYAAARGDTSRSIRRRTVRLATSRS